MTVDRNFQVPAARPVQGCFRSSDRIAQGGRFSRVLQAERRWREPRLDAAT